MNKHIYLSLLFSVFFLCSMNASHLVGGEISYECIGNNQYKISLTVYRDCASTNTVGTTTPFDANASCTIFKGDGSLYNTASPNFTMSHSAPELIPVISYDSCTVPSSLICLDKAVYETTLILPFDSLGYYITYQRCCRPSTLINIINPQSTGISLTTFISSQAQQNCNTSPVFNSNPPVVFCVNTTVAVDASATDIDGNTLVYSLCAPSFGGSLNNPMPLVATPPPYNSIGYNTGYSATQPLGNISINSQTGLISGNTMILGFYSVAVCVDEYDNGVWIGSSKRDFTVGVVDCISAVNAGIDADSTDQFGNYVITTCNTDIDFHALPNSMPFNANYNWSFTINSNIVTSNTSNPTITFPGVGSYTGKLVAELDSLGCKDSVNIIVNVIANNSLNIDFSYQYDSTTIDSTHFQSVVLSNDSIVSWLWDFGDGNFSTLENPIHLYQDTGLYQVNLTVTTFQGCTTQTTKTVEWMPIPILLFSTQSSLAKEIIIYPNPAKDVVRLKFNKPTFTNDYSVIIYNSIGEKVLIHHNINLTGDAFISIDISHLLKGTYFLKVLNRDKMQVLKLSILD